MMDSADDVTGPISPGNPREFTMLELAEKTLKLVGGASTIEYRPLPTDDPRQRQPVIDMARDVLGWAPTVALDDGLNQTVDYFRAA